MSSPALRDNLRLAATVMLVNGFTSITGLPFGLYASQAVLSVTVGNYGNTLELGRQRLVGTAVGAVVVFIGYRAWGHLPLLVALPLTLLLARLIAGSLKLTVGYTVCCFMVVMGWLSHGQQLDSWIPLRLLWTAFGIVMALLSLRLFWPSQARIVQRQGLLTLLVELGDTLHSLNQASAPHSQRRRLLGQQLRNLRSTLLSLRSQRQAALLELGPMASQHPHARLWDLLDQASESLILALDELRRLPEPEWRSWGLQPVASAGQAYVQAASQRLLLWKEQLGRSYRLQLPPATPRPVLPVEEVRTPEALGAFQRLNDAQLEQVSSRLMMLSRIDHTLESTERQWAELVI